MHFYAETLNDYINWDTLIKAYIIKDNIWGQYSFEEKLGEGAFGKVYLAYSTKNEYMVSNEKVAIKVLNK